jgi:hypothetical protein
MESPPDERIARVEISGRMDRHAAEALQLELRRLAKRHGVNIKDVRIDRPEA